jgi:ABC-type sugar transport system ATPase subunit
MGAGVPADGPVRTLSVAQQQMIEIARALSGEAKVLVFDEPSASLSGREVDRLQGVIRRLRERGLGIVYVSHRFEEIFAVADRVTVLRDGRRVAGAPVAGLDRKQLIRWMVGRDVSEDFAALAEAGCGCPRGVESSAPPRFHDVSFTVRAGKSSGWRVWWARVGRRLDSHWWARSAGQAACNSRIAGDVHVAGRRHRARCRLSDRGSQRPRHLPLMSAAANVTLSNLRAYRAAACWVARERRREAAARDSRWAASLGQPASTLSAAISRNFCSRAFCSRSRASSFSTTDTRRGRGRAGDIYHS